MRTRAAVVPIAILFCRCFSPLLQSSRVLVCSVPPGSLTLLRYLFVFCTASLQPQTSPSPPTPCSSSFFFFFFRGFCPRHVFYTSLFRHLTRSTCPGLPDQLFFLPVTVQISIPETPRDRWGCGPFVHMCTPVSLTRESRNTIGYVNIGPYRISTIDWEITFFINRFCVDCELILICRRFIKTFFKISTVI